ncbi:hypothetical protein AB1Y20_018856 [Prymnesium parvum]|uniref:Uncharacterized protein n=1 Tax=Prymnesium parvum TaxID=97485 RepID=A0AB34JQX4_PRYPA
MLLLPLAALSLRLSPLASRPPLHFPAAPRGRPTTMSDADVPAIVIGGGRIGQTLATLGESVLLRRGEPFPASPSSGPIYVCTRNDALAAVVAATPPERRGDLVFMQNGMLGKFLAANGLEDATQVLLYLAVAKLGEKPIDGITEVNPEGLTASTGKWAHAFKARLAKGGLTCHVREGDAYTKAMLEKHVWICAFMLVGALHDGITVGEVEAKHSDELRAVIEELIAAGETELGVRLDDGAYERLAAYGRSVSHFPTAVKEFEWRNGWFYDISLKATDAGKPDPMPMHTAGLTKLGVIPSSS